MADYFENGGDPLGFIKLGKCFEILATVFFPRYSLVRLGNVIFKDNFCQVIGSVICSELYLHLWLRPVVYFRCPGLWFIAYFCYPESTFHNQNKLRICRKNVPVDF
jgi:hypothetical protein